MLPFFPRNRALRPEGLLHSRGIARSGLRPLTKIPYCCLPQESGPCLSPNVAVRPLRPAMHHRLGGPLPRQQTNAPQVHPRPIPERMFHRKKMPPSCTSGFVLRFQSVFPVRGQVPYVLLTRSPLETRRSLVRLACIRHAASVHPEPGSNSPFDLYSDALRLVFMIVFQVQRIDVVSSCIYFVFPVRFSKSVSTHDRCFHRLQLLMKSQAFQRY